MTLQILHELHVYQHVYLLSSPHEPFTKHYHDQM